MNRFTLLSRNHNHTLIRDALKNISAERIPEVHAHSHGHEGKEPTENQKKANAENDPVSERFRLLRFGLSGVLVGSDALSLFLVCLRLFGGA